MTLPSKAARESAPSTGTRPPTASSSTTMIDLTDAPPKETMSTSYTQVPVSPTTEEPYSISQDIEFAIDEVPEEQLRSAILEVCKKLPEAARLLGQFILPLPSGSLDRKRKRSTEICDDCGEAIDNDGDACCEGRREDLAEMNSVEGADICGNCGSIDKDGGYLGSGICSECI